MFRVSSRVVISVLFISTSMPVSAQNVAPELFVDGSCEERAAWAAQPVEVLEADLDEMLASDAKAKMNEAMAKQVLSIIERMPVTDNWFAGTCTFSDAQLEAMAPLKEAYTKHMTRKLGL